MKSWKTTLCGIVGLLGALISQFYPEYARHGAFLAALGAGLGLIFARDHGAGGPPDLPQPVKITNVALWLLMAVGIMVMFTGCARFHSVQVETSLDGSRRETRQTISTFWDSKSEVSKVRATTTDKSQGLSIGSVSESSSGTNATDLVKSAVGAAVSAAVGAVKP